MESAYWEFVSEHFSPGEFDSRDEPGSGVYMNSDFMIPLHAARSMSYIPFRISSGYRTKAHNKKVGGVANSAHLRGYAADILTRNNAERAEVLRCLISAGFNRIGIAKNFIHVDNDPLKSSPRIWLYR